MDTPDTTVPVYPRVLPVGESAFTVEFGARVDPALNRRVHALDALLRRQDRPGILELVPSYRALLVLYDPGRVTAPELRAQLLALAQGGDLEAPAPEGRLIELPVRYGGEAGPDLDAVAAHTGLTPEEVIRLHSRPVYTVAMLGFAPGFAYLLGLPERLSTPRLSTPRLQVAPGSVGIAGSQTGVYALNTPGGWQIIGRTDLRLFDPVADPPFRIEAGDCVRFVAHSADA